MMPLKDRWRKWKEYEEEEEPSPLIVWGIEEDIGSYSRKLKI